ncbi:MAG: mismatch-specific DNA-glycosylase [Chloroflexota bacterium]|nr:mismatch-specific DNA-glycosylase [Chloroflexota bacterium]MDE2918752.1 mismatch-specific DNA-glycosylase [Chloroflexota bacterium]
MTTLPDYLEPGLDIVLVGINPSAYSVRAGHYYARPGNRFWNAANRAGLFGEPLGPETDARVLEFGIGLTDVVKRPTPTARDLRAADYRHWAPVLKEKIRRFRPRIVCFQGIGGYRNYLRHGEGLSATTRLRPGRQARALESSVVFLVPSPSSLNTRYSFEDLVGCYRRLRALRDELNSV